MKSKLVLLLTLVILLCMPLLLFWSTISRFDAKEPDRKVRKGAIVLGAAVQGNHPSPALQERLEMAYHLYSNHLVTFIVLTGGTGLGRNLSEAEIGKDYLTRRGIPETQLILENRSTNTQENLRFASVLLKNYNLSNVYLITHDYHMNRALYYAKQQQIEVSPAPVHSKVLFMPFRKLQESYSYLKWKAMSFYE